LHPANAVKSAETIIAAMQIFIALFFIIIPPATLYHILVLRQEKQAERIRRLFLLCLIVAGEKFIKLRKKIFHLS
jgi:hypothetical protein